MIFVGVAGPPGSGKTTLLREIAVQLTERGRRVQGFLADAVERAEPGRGADRYELILLPSGDRIPFAVRDESLSPPYRFAPSPEVDFDRPDVVVIDQMGAAELAGKGHHEVWERAISADPSAVFVALDPRFAEDLERHFGFRFDLIVSPSDSGALARLVDVAAQPRDWEAVGLFGGASGAMEVTLGSFLHAARVPLRGQVLSTLQALMLTSAAEGLEQKSRVAWVGIISAALKALSPAGNRLRPMVAISSQGVLFAAALRIFGWNPFAVAVGGFIVGAWAAVQGVVLQWLLIGGEIFKAYDAVVRWIAGALGLGAPALPAVLTVIVVLSGLLTGGSCAAFWRRRHRGMERLMSFADRKRPVARETKNWREAFLGAARDLLNPAFWLPLLLVVAILNFAGSPWNETFWIAMRALGVALVLFGIARMFRPREFARWLRKRGLYGPAIGVERAFRRD